MSLKIMSYLLDAMDKRKEVRRGNGKVVISGDGTALLYHYSTAIYRVDTDGRRYICLDRLSVSTVRRLNCISGVNLSTRGSNVILNGVGQMQLEAGSWWVQLPY